MMRRMLAIGLLNLRQILRDPGELVGVLALPIALTLVFGAAFGGGGERPMQVPVADEDGSAYARQVIALLEAEPSLDVTLVARAEAERRVRERECPAAVVLPPGFGEGVERGGATIRVLRDPASDSAYATMAVVRGVATRLSGNVAAAQALASLPVPGARLPFEERYRAADARWEPRPPVGVSGQTVIASEVRSDTEIAPTNTQYSTGFTVMFIMFVTFGGAAGILEEREQGTLRRLLVAPVSKTAIIAGKIAGIVMTALLQAAILVGVGVTLFRVPWGSDPVAVVALLVSYILAVTGLAVLLSAFVRSRDQYAGLGPLLTISLAMLGGSFWPLEIVSPFMRTLAKLTPTGWAMTGLTDVVARHQGFSAALVPVLVLLGFAAVSLGIGARILRFE